MHQRREKKKLSPPEVAAAGWGSGAGAAGFSITERHSTVSRRLMCCALGLSLPQRSLRSGSSQPCILGVESLGKLTSDWFCNNFRQSRGHQREDICNCRSFWQLELPALVGGLHKKKEKKAPHPAECVVRLWEAPWWNSFSSAVSVPLCSCEDNQPFITYLCLSSPGLQSGWTLARSTTTDILGELPDIYPPHR